VSGVWRDQIRQVLYPKDENKPFIYLSWIANEAASGVKARLSRATRCVASKINRRIMHTLLEQHDVKLGVDPTGSHEER
jgi:hypothetical protein